ncbi:MAG TPA: hypothetical protein VFS43_15715 [Polyangiaceae bacterium]|nr:hypothetical protein [Polyangiaceae bacterium]
MNSDAPAGSPGRFCVRCKAPAPKTESAHTLISQRHGWRCVKRRDRGERPVLEWFCASCWQQRKRAGGV